MSNIQFIRQAEVIIGSSKYLMSGFEMSFDIKFDDDPEPNTGRIKIYNLSQSSVNQMTKGQNVIINAGYQGDIGTIFVGKVDKILQDISKVDKVVNIDIGDATDAWANTYVNKSYSPGIKASQVINDILGSFGLEIGKFQLVNDLVYTNGKVVTGPLQKVLKDIVVKDCLSKFHIINGVIMISPQNFGTTTGFLLNASTGLISSPTKISDDKGKVDYKVRCLLNHRISTDSLIQIQSKTANGNFRVVKGKHIGSNSGDFFTEMEVKAI